MAEIFGRNSQPTQLSGGRQVAKRLLARPVLAQVQRGLSGNIANCAARAMLQVIAMRAVVASGLVLSFVFAQFARADTVQIGASRDSTMYAEDGTRSNGQGLHIFTGVTDQSVERRALISFDVASAIPPGSMVTSATLTLRLTRTRTQNLAVAIHAVREAWGEAGSKGTGEEGSGGPAQTGDATWTKRLYPTTAWTTAGGYYVANASATTTVGNSQIEYTWTSPGMTSDVQGWLDTPSTNHGWILIAPAAGKKETKRFASRNNTDATLRPRLAITFTAPLSGACCAPDGGCTVVLAPGSSCTGSYRGNATSCTPNACPQPTGACCLPTASATCSEVSQASCASSAGTFRGSGTSCAVTACPVVLAPFVDALPIPRAAQPTSGTSGGAASYTLAVVQLQRKMHSALPPTTLWGYDDGAGASSPGPTIEARTGDPIAMTWKNDLREAGQLRTTHALAVDSCVSPDTSPRTVMHLHGGHVPASSDGYPKATQLPGEQVTYGYPNAQPAATLWYHDHAMGITRLNVMMGLAGFYLVRDASEAALGLPAGANEIPLVIQDRTFGPDGQLRYPAAWQSEFAGDKLLVNGVVWPYLQVNRGKYRFRVLDGSTSRSYDLALSNNATFHVIGSDGGLLAAPVPVTSLMLMPGERADVVIDFASYAPGTELVLENRGADITNIMKFVVTSTSGHTAALPATLATIGALDPATAAQSRDFVLGKRSDACGGEAWTINGLSFDDITERPTLGTVEVWRFINNTGVAHPMHMHLVQFQILDRQAYTWSGTTPIGIGSPRPPAPNEAGWKDTVAVPPGEMVRVIARFDDYTGKFPYHCHMIEHEDHDMMRQFEVVAAPAGTDAGVDAGTSDAAIDVPDAGADSDAGVRSDAPTNPGTGTGGGCCRTSDEGPPFVELGLVAIALGLRRRRRKVPT